MKFGTMLGTRSWVVRFGALILVAVMVLTACGQAKSPTATVKSTPPAATPTKSSGTPAATPTPSKTLSVAETYRERYNPDRLSKELPGWKNPPVYGGVLYAKTPTGAIPPSWDVTGTGSNFSYILRQFTNGLVNVKQGDTANNRLTELEGDLAQSWEVSQDGKVFTFRLRQGIKFWNQPPANGRELTSDDVVFSLQTFQAKTALLKPLLSVVEKIEAVDKYTVRLTTTDPAPYLILGLAQPPAVVFAKEAFADTAAFGKGIIASTGPFIPDELVEQVKLTMKKNPTYFKKDSAGRQLPYLDRVERLFFADPATELAAFRTDKVMEYVPFGINELEDLKKSNPETIFTIVPPGPTGPYAIYPRLDKAPWSDVRVRRAFSLAIDRQSIIDVAYGGLAAYGAPMSWTFLGSEYPLEAGKLGPYVKYDPQQAKQLLADAGFSSGLKANVITTETSGAFFNALLQMQANLKSAGIDMQIQSVDRAARNAQFFAGNWADLADTRYLTSGIDPDDYTYAQLYSKSSANVAHVNDPTMDTLVLQQRTIANAADRQKALQQIQDREMDQVYHFWIANPYKVMARKPYVYNYTDNIFYWAYAFGSRVIEQTWIAR